MEKSAIGDRVKFVQKIVDDIPLMEGDGSREFGQLQSIRRTLQMNLETLQVKLQSGDFKEVIYFLTRTFHSLGEFQCRLGIYKERTNE
jgi:hypothetical protein